MCKNKIGHNVIIIVIKYKLVNHIKILWNREHFCGGVLIKKS